MSQDPTPPIDISLDRLADIANDALDQLTAITARITEIATASTVRSVPKTPAGTRVTRGAHGYRGEMIRHSGALTELLPGTIIGNSADIAERAEPGHTGTTLFVARDSGGPGFGVVRVFSQCDPDGSYPRRLGGIENEFPASSIFLPVWVISTT